MLKRLFCLIFPVLAVGATMTNAQTFDVTLGGRSLGSLTYSNADGEAKLRTTLDNTPLGVFDGSFVGTSRRVQADQGATVRQYYSEGVSSRKTRKISVLMDQGRAIETVISPQSERTDLSNPQRITASVVDPVTALGLVISASGCPTSISIYDGRRVIALTPSGSTSQTDVLVCDMDYTVVSGPGHLSPLYIKDISAVLTYDLGASSQNLVNMRFSSGVFALGFTRK